MGAILSGLAGAVNPMNSPAQGGPTRGLLGLAGRGIARYRAQQLQNQANANAAPTPGEQDWATNQLSAANGTTGADANANAQPGAMSNFAGEGPQDGAGGDAAGAVGGGDEIGMDAFQHGSVVTKPTIALLGENGPEIIRPMSNNPLNKINAPAVVPRYRQNQRVV